MLYKSLVRPHSLGDLCGCMGNSRRERLIFDRDNSDQMLKINIRCKGEYLSWCYWCRCQYHCSKAAHSGSLRMALHLAFISFVWAWLTHGMWVWSGHWRCWPLLFQMSKAWKHLTRSATVCARNPVRRHALWQPEFNRFCVVGTLAAYMYDNVWCICESINVQRYLRLPSIYTSDSTSSLRHTFFLLYETVKNRKRGIQQWPFRSRSLLSG